MSTTVQIPALPGEPCPLSPVIGLIFGRWTTTIIWTLGRHGRLRFSELKALVPDVTPKVLTQRLRQLETDGLLTRTYHSEVPPRVEYELTALAGSLRPIFDAIIDWSERHLDEVEGARARAKRR